MSFLFADSIEVSALQQQCEKTLSKIFCLFRVGALSSDKTINWAPVCGAKFLERGLRSGCWTLRLQHHAPMCGGECRTAMSVAVDRGQRRHIVCSGGHMAIESKTR